MKKVKIKDYWINYNYAWFYNKVLEKTGDILDNLDDWNNPYSWGELT